MLGVKKRKVRGRVKSKGKWDNNGIDIKQADNLENMALLHRKARQRKGKNIAVTGLWQ